jgi:hypothetical protein
MSPVIVIIVDVVMAVAVVVARIDPRTPPLPSFAVYTVSFHASPL